MDLISIEFVKWKSSHDIRHIRFIQNESQVIQPIWVTRDSSDAIQRDRFIVTLSEVLLWSPESILQSLESFPVEQSETF